MERKEENIVDFEQAKLIHDIVEDMKLLTQEQREVVLWVMYHIEFLDIIDSRRILPEDELNSWIERAVEEHDLGLQGLIYYKRTKDEMRSGEKNPS